ncbi:MAG: hypothetical protein P8J32_01055 [bacterium]|jgi:hypothetical protein|nr:hypothetical protein [bacterium]
MEDFEETLEFELEPDTEFAQSRIDAAERDRLALQMLKQTRDTITHVIQLLEEGDTARATRHLVDAVSRKHSSERSMQESGSRVVEGVFDGQSMMGGDGVRYDVPSNYASKSKLVEGDMMKLVIRPNGSYLYKQIGPVERHRKTGILTMDSSTQTPVVQVDEDVYNVLEASVSYFKGIPGDEVVIIIPAGGRCRWAAVERISN